MGARETRTYPDWVLERVQGLEFEVLRAIDKICRDEGLVYFADGGTCLGAMRHGGFIPWDDDIDLGMPIDDYRKFLRIAPKRLPEGMSLHTMEDTDGYSELWAKVYVDGTRFLDEGALEAGCQQCVFVDIFPYIPLSGPVEAAARRLHVTQTWQKASYLRHKSASNVPDGASHRALKVAACTAAHGVLSRVTSDAFVRRRFEKAFPRKATGEYWANPCAPRPYPYLRDVLFPPRELAFGDMSIFVPHDVDAYLTQLYGDYRTLPEPEKRHTHTPVVLDLGDGTNVMEVR
jgi:lipopolysaccharide cholinephosphotransferase